MERCIDLGIRSTFLQLSTLEWVARRHSAILNAEPIVETFGATDINNDAVQTNPIDPRTLRRVDFERTVACVMFRCDCIVIWITEAVLRAQV